MIARLDQLTAPVEVGVTYMVPTVVGEWQGLYRAWPVIGPQHNDTQCLKFENQHYHLDARFMTEPRIGGNKWPTAQGFWTSVMASPLQTSGRINPLGLPKPVWKKKLCRRLANPFTRTLMGKARDGHPLWACHFRQWAGKQARHDGRGWVCPHRNVPLADHASVDGVIICPLHLLRIDVETGRVLEAEGGVV